MTSSGLRSWSGGRRRRFPEMKPVYGIDFGTTNSSIAFMRFTHRLNGKVPHTVPVDPNGTPSTVLKSLVTLTPDGEHFVGRMAGMAAATPRAKLFKSIKSEFGKRDWSCVYGGKRYDAAMIASLILRELKAKADLNMGEPGEGAVIGVPVGFDDHQKVVLLKAAILAGIVPDAGSAAQQIRFVSEPVAVAVNYGIELRSDQRVLVFDFGGGTLDLTIMDMRNVEAGLLQDRQVLAKQGMRLGGDDLDMLLLSKMVAAQYGEDRLLRELGIHHLEEIYGPEAGWRLMEMVERSKCELSGAPASPLLFREYGLRIKAELTRTEFEQHMQPMLESIRRLITQTLKVANQGRSPLSPSDIDVVVMAGGSSLLPCVQNLLREIFGAHKVRVHDNPLTSIAEGLAQLADAEPNRAPVEDITDIHYGVWDYAKDRVSVIVPAGTPYRATAFDASQMKGISKSYYLLNSTSEHVDLDIYKLGSSGESELLHTVRIPIARGYSEPDKPRLDVFFSIDPDKGWLSVHVFDRYEQELLEVPTNSQVRIRW